MKVSQLWLVYNLWMIFLREQLCSILLNFVQFPATNFVIKSSFEINYVFSRMTLPGYIGTEVFHSLCDFLPFVYSRCLVWTLSLKCNCSCILNRHPWFYSFHMAIWLLQVQSWVKAGLIRNHGHCYQISSFWSTWNVVSAAILIIILIILNQVHSHQPHHHSDQPGPGPPKFPHTL